MNQRLTYLLPFVAAAAIMAANGCGDDDDDFPGTAGSAGKTGNAGKGGSGGGGGGSAGGTQGAAGGTQGSAGGTQGSAGGTQGAGGNTQGSGGGGGGGAGGAPPSEKPTDTCQDVPFVAVQSATYAPVVSNETFGESKNDYILQCRGAVLKSGPDMVVGVTAPTAGFIRLRTQGEKVDGLDVGLVVSSQCQNSSVEICGNNAPNVGLGFEQIQLPVIANQKFYVFMRNVSADPAATADDPFSVNAALMAPPSPPPQANTCGQLGQPLELQLKDVDNPATELVVVGTTLGAGSDETVPTPGAGGAGGGANPACPTGGKLEPAKGEEQMVAIRPLADGVLIAAVQRANGDTQYQPVVWAREAACDSSGSVVGCGVGANGLAGIGVPVTAGKTYYVVIDSLNALVGGSYIANIFLSPPLPPPANGVALNYEGPAERAHLVARDGNGKVIADYAPALEQLTRESRGRTSLKRLFATSAERFAK
jgi:hypothetical protein